MERRRRSVEKTRRGSKDGVCMREGQMERRWRGREESRKGGEGWFVRRRKPLICELLNGRSGIQSRCL